MILGFGTKAELIFATNIVLKLKKDLIKIGRAAHQDQNPLPLRLIDDGRSIEIDNTVLTNPISKVHGEFTWNKQLKKYEYTDLSRNGSWINDVKISRGKKQALNNKDRLALGNATLKVQIIYP